MCCYTGLLLRRCVDMSPGCQSYADIGQHAFGSFGRHIVAALLYLELLSCAVEFLIMPGDAIPMLRVQFVRVGL